MSTRRRFIQTAGLAGAGLASGLASFPARSRAAAPSDTLRLGVIGTGGRGAWAISVAQALADIEVVACCDVYPPNLEKGLSLAAPGAKSYTDYRRLLEDPGVDAVVIATPLYLHAQMALDALDAGKHVYCEKTMTYDIDSSLAVRARALAHPELVFQVGYQQRVNPLFARIYETISLGYIGPVKYITCTWNRNGDWRRAVPSPDLERLINWRMYQEYSGGLMAELSSHQIDIVNWMLGSHPESVTGLGGVDFWQDGRETYDNATAIFAYPGGVKAQFSCLTTNAKEGFSMKFYGTRATIEVARAEGQQGYIYPEPQQGANDTNLDAVSGATKAALEAGDPIPIWVPEANVDDRLPTGNAFAHFYQCIRDGNIPNASVEAGHLAGVAVHMANIAIREGRFVNWETRFD